MISLNAIAGATLLTLVGIQVGAQAQTLEVLSTEPSAPHSEPDTSATDLLTEPIELAQRRRPRSSRDNSPYFLGVGANIGIDDEDSVAGDTNFAVISKISFAESISLRPSALIGDDVGFLIPVTYNFDTPNFIPYLGGGVAIGTGDYDDFAGLVVAGTDFSISEHIIINGQANLAVGDNTGIGIMLGVAYGFGAF